MFRGAAAFKLTREKMTTRHARTSSADLSRANRRDVPHVRQGSSHIRNLMRSTQAGLTPEADPDGSEREISTAPTTPRPLSRLACSL